LPRGNSLRYPRSFGSRRRKTAWSVGPQQGAAATITAAGVDLWSLGSQIISLGLTQVRLRGIFTAWIESATAVGDGFTNVAIGICVVSENAFNAGVGSVPDPVVDVGWDGWLYHANLGPVISLSTTEEGGAGLTMVRHVIDSKAMRKAQATDVTIGVASFETEVGAAILRFTSRTRILDKLP